MSTWALPLTAIQIKQIRSKFTVFRQIPWGLLSFLWRTSISIVAQSEKCFGPVAAVTLTCHVCVSLCQQQQKNGEVFAFWLFISFLMCCCPRRRRAMSIIDTENHCSLKLSELWGIYSFPNRKRRAGKKSCIWKQRGHHNCISVNTDPWSSVDCFVWAAHGSCLDLVLFWA